MTDGNFAAWESLYKQAIALKNDAGAESSRTARYMQMRGLNPNGTPNATYPVLLDVDNLIDYMLVVFFDGSFDSPMSTFLSNASNNWFGVRIGRARAAFSFYVHDHEHGMESVSDGRAYNRTGPWGGSGLNEWGQTQYNSRENQINTFYSKSNPQYVHEMLAYSAEYRQRFADRVQRHFFNNGALTTTSALARLNTLAAEVDTFVHAEAARWGSSTLNRNSWLNVKNTVTGFINAGGAGAERLHKLRSAEQRPQFTHYSTTPGLPGSCGHAEAARRHARRADFQRTIRRSRRQPALVHDHQSERCDRRALLFGEWRGSSCHRRRHRCRRADRRESGDGESQRDLDRACAGL
jgi:hypothetical protein